MRKYIYLFLKLFAITLFLVGCNGTDNSPKKNLNLENSNKASNSLSKVELNDRIYYLAKPSTGFDVNKAYKLLLVFHGSRQDATYMRDISNFENTSKDYIVVYPQSQVEEWNEGCDCNKPHRLGINDLGFVEALVADVKSKYNIIENELYGAGFSQGGLFVQNLMCNSSLKFTALASVASPMSKQLSQQCRIENNTNYLMVHGKNDSVLPFMGLEHSNFGLISSEQAINIIAKENDIETEVKVDIGEDMSTLIFENDSNINKLVALERGQHSWHFTNFNSTNEILHFFDSVSDTPLDQFSSLYRINETSPLDVHVRSMGLEHDGPAVILLSGFNKNYHSDSAWFSLLQPLIAKTHRVHAIERFGNGFSSLVAEPAYASFAPALDQTLAVLNEEAFIMVSFASGNLLAHTWQNSSDSTMVDKLTGLVWIDPDVLQPHSISLYQDYPVSWYRDVQESLMPHIEQGNWTERTLVKIESEKTEIEALIAPEYSEDMDWPYFNLISQRRANIPNQLNRAIEVINYHDDLAIAYSYDINLTVPITVIDSDFESIDIAEAEEEYVDRLTLWQQEGINWSKAISEKTGGQYIPLENSDHMVIFQNPAVIIKAISELN